MQATQEKVGAMSTKSRNVREYEGVLSAALSDRDLRSMYEQSSAVRPAIDYVSETVGNLSWQILPKGNKEVESFFMEPNKDGDDIGSIITQVITDWMVVNRCSVEKVRDRGGKLAEVLIRNPSEIRVKYDEFGKIESYRRTIDGISYEEEYGREDMIFQVFMKSSWKKFGTSILQTIANEVIALLFSTHHIGKTFTSDEIPPGILLLDRLSRPERERFEKKKERDKDQGDLDLRLKVLWGIKDGRWLDLKKSFKDVQMLELRQDIEKIVFRNVGVLPLEMGLSDKTGKTTAREQMVISIRRLSTLKRRIENLFNKFIIPDLVGNADVTFNLRLRKEDGDIPFSDLRSMVADGLLTANEARYELGYDEKEGGDVLYPPRGNTGIPVSVT